MTETTSAEDFADYIDPHQRKAPPAPEKVERSHTPDVADTPVAEPPD
jgi:hypothetical protein